MSIKDLAQGKYILWGANWSLYTAITRPYLIKKGIDYIELNPSHPHFRKHVLPQIGHKTIPVLEKPDGEIIADSAEIIKYFEKENTENSLTPKNKALHAIAALIHSYGAEGLHKPAMYYRWNTTFENREFIIDDFSRAWETKTEIDNTELPMGKEYADFIRNNYLPVLGIRFNNDVDKAIEQSTMKLYDILNSHLLEYPYILGGLPSVADFGLMGPIYAHLGRDISSNSQLKKRAPALYRWIETMHRTPIIDPEIWYVAPEYFEPDELPDTLKALLALMCDDYAPEIIATADLFHQWLDTEDRAPEAIPSYDGKKANHLILGEIEHQQQGVTIQRSAMLDTLIHHQHIDDIKKTMNEQELTAYNIILNTAGGNNIANLALSRRMKRNNYCTVLS